MKNNAFMLLIMIGIFSLLSTSCLKTDDVRKTHTAEEEIALRNALLDSLAAKGHNIDTTANGVYYVVIEQGSGPKAKALDTLTVGYAGYFIGGTMFDSSELREDGKFKFVLEGDQMIPGWTEGMKVMNKNAKVEFIIPSELAYGSRGHMGIPPYQTLIFVVKLYDIKPSPVEN